MSSFSILQTGFTKPCHLCSFLFVFLILFSSVLKVRGAATDGDRGGYEDEFDFELDVESPNVAKVNSSGRAGKLFPFLAVVRIPPQQCTAGTMGVGVCRTTKQCTNLGGQDSGSSCGDGLGICCVVTTSCSANSNGSPITVASTGTHITQPSMFTPPLNCQFQFPRPPGVCQVRLDFVNFMLTGPNANGDCNRDSFTVAGATNINQFIACGNSTGQHLILDYGSAETIQANVNLMAGDSKYDILVNYVKCPSGSGSDSSSSNNNRKGRRFNSGGSGNRKGGSSKGGGGGGGGNNGTTIEPAPPGCAQYFTTMTGEVRSFNWQPSSDPMAIPGSGTMQYQINNEKYAVCIKSFPGTSMITWTACDDPQSFFVTSIGQFGSLTGSQCMTDWVDIPGGTMGGRYCGSAFPQSVTSTIMPYMLYVMFDESETFMPNAPIDPSTGCPTSADCAYFGDPIIPPNIPDGAVYPCPSDPALLPDFEFCQTKQFYTDNSDGVNTGFCLRYSIT